MIKSIFTTLVFLVGILIVGRYILSHFPEVVPYWESVKQQASSLWHTGVATFGVVGTLVLILGLSIALKK